MAGGSGTRLWPVSTKSCPKQVLQLFGSMTLAQMTYDRVRKGIRADHVWVATSKDHYAELTRQLPRVPTSHFSVEPVRRETAPALALALTKVIASDPAAAFVYVNADNVVKDVRGFHRTLRRAENIIRHDPERVVLVGVKPSYPETGYGYIEMGRRTAGGARRVVSFKEKPNRKTAERYVRSGKFLWNPTLIVARAAHFLHLFEMHLPDVLHHVKNGAFHRAPSTTIDRGILEKEKNMLVIPAEFDWTDVGTWRALYDALARYPRENVVRGQHQGIDSSGNLLFSESKKQFATIGLHDFVVVETHDAILIVPKSRAQDVKKLSHSHAPHHGSAH